MSSFLSLRKYLEDGNSSPGCCAPFWTRGDAACPLHFRNPVRVFLFVFSWGFSTGSSRCLIYTFSPTITTSTNQPAIFHPIGSGYHRIPIFSFAQTPCVGRRWLQGKTFPQTAGLQLRNAQEKSKSHKLLAANSREINTKFQSQKCADRANTRPEKKLLIPLLWLLIPPYSSLSHSTTLRCTYIILLFLFPVLFVVAGTHTTTRAQYLRITSPHEHTATPCVDPGVAVDFKFKKNSHSP